MSLLSLIDLAQPLKLLRNIGRVLFEGHDFKSSPSPLGTFSKLPPELRSEIWKYFMHDLCPEVAVPPKCKPGATDDRAPTRLDILQTSRTIYDELSAMLYDKELCFYFDASDDTFLSQRWTLGGSLAAQQIRLRSLVPSRFEKIRFEIDAKDDILEIMWIEVSLRSILTSMRTSLQLSFDLQRKHGSAISGSLARMPQISINFRRGQSVIHPGSSSENSDDTRSTKTRFYGIVRTLRVFRDLGHVERLSIRLHEDLEPKDLKNPWLIDSVLSHLQDEMYHVLQFSL